jgi:hypothetical protein
MATLAAIGLMYNFFPYGTVEQFKLGDFTVFSGNGGIFDHAHSVELAEVTPDLRRLGAVFAFTQKQHEYMHNHDDTYFVKKPNDGEYILDVYHVVNGAAEKVLFLNVNAFHRHQVQVIYTPSAVGSMHPTTSNRTQPKAGRKQCRV